MPRKPHTTADKRLMSEVSDKFRYEISKRFKGKARVAQAAKGLGVSRASMYNYIGRRDVPGLDVLQTAHEKWGLDFEYGDLKLNAEFFRRHKAERSPSETRQAHQYVLPFLEGLREEDIEVIEVSPRKPSSVEVRLRIKFAG